MSPTCRQLSDLQLLSMRTGMRLSLTVRGIFIALSCLLVTVVERILLVLDWLCLCFLWPCFLHPEILTFPQHGARCSTCFEISDPPSLDSDVDIEVSTIGHCRTSRADIHRLYFADGYQSIGLHGPASITLRPLSLYEHLDSFGSGINKHMPQNVPEHP